MVDSMHDKLHQSGVDLPSFSTLHHAAELQPITFDDEEEAPVEEVYVPPPVRHSFLPKCLSCDIAADALSHIMAL